MEKKKDKAPGFFDKIFQDILDFSSRPETHSYIEDHIVKPLLLRIFKQLYPYCMGILILWVLMFLCLAVILLSVLRGSLVGLGTVA